MTTADASLPPLDLRAPTLDPLALAAELMAAESTSGAEGPAIDRMEAVLQARGWRVTRIPVTPGRDDLFAEGELPAEVTFSTHLDTVPPYIAPRIAGDRLLGRGACDAKGIAAAMVCAAERLRARGVPVGLLFVVGEETAHDGAHAADEAQPRIAPRSRVLINGEPTESLLGTGTKGALRFTLRTAGRACHSAYPQLGRSAIQSLARLVVELESLPLPSDPVLGATTINVGSVSGGVADNVVPPSAEARLMARLVGPQHELETVLDAWVAGRATVTYGITVPAVRLAPCPASAPASWRSRPTSRRSARGERRTCTGPARSTWPTPTTSTSRSRSCARPWTRTCGSRAPHGEDDGRAVRRADAHDTRGRPPPVGAPSCRARAPAARAGRGQRRYWYSPSSPATAPPKASALPAPSPMISPITTAAPPTIMSASARPKPGPPRRGAFASSAPLSAGRWAPTRAASCVGPRGAGALESTGATGARAVTGAVAGSCTAACALRAGASRTSASDARASGSRNGRTTDMRSSWAWVVYAASAPMEDARRKGGVHRRAMRTA
jgi:acetylornithine deacetylase